MRTLAPSLAVAALLVAVGVYHGMATDRWRDAAAAANPGTALGLSFGDWQGQILPRDANDDPKTSILHCRFTHAKSGQWIMTAVSTGKPGYVAVHNPEHCYLGSGYKIVDSIRDYALAMPNGDDSHFWTGHFQKKKATGVESIRIYWGWTTNGQWQAPDYPRLYFAGRSVLHKLYFIHAFTGNESPDELHSYEEFMRQYVTQLNQQIGSPR